MTTTTYPLGSTKQCTTCGCIMDRVRGRYGLYWKHQNDEGRCTKAKQRPRLVYLDPDKMVTLIAKPIQWE